MEVVIQFPPIKKQSKKRSSKNVDRTHEYPVFSLQGLQEEELSW